MAPLLPKENFDLEGVVAVVVVIAIDSGVEGDIGITADSSLIGATSSSPFKRCDNETGNTWQHPLDNLVRWILPTIEGDLVAEGVDEEEER